jgi:Mn2+/Fe2+ NRAMP family transporter
VDVISLVIQAVGGASASFAFQKNPPGSTTKGTHIMVAGILFQLASIIVFSVLFSLVIKRALRSGSNTLKGRKVQAIIAATVFAVVCVVIRSIYRTIELLQGWTGYLITRERFFLALDGLMMVLVAIVFVIAQPKWSETGEAVVESNELDEMMVQGDESQK